MRNPAHRGGEDGYASQTPLADLHMDLLAINHEQLVLERQQLELERLQLALEDRQQKLMGIFQDLLWRLEPGKRKTAPVVADAA